MFLLRRCEGCILCCRYWLYHCIPPCHVLCRDVSKGCDGSPPPDPVLRHASRCGTVFPRCDRVSATCAPVRGCHPGRYARWLHAGAKMTPTLRACVRWPDTLHYFTSRYGRLQPTDGLIICKYTLIVNVARSYRFLVFFVRGSTLPHIAMCTRPHDPRYPCHMFDGLRRSYIG